MNEERIHSGAYSVERAAPTTCALTELLRGLLFPGDESESKKFDDHRRFTAVALGILAVFLPLLWGWDYG